MRKQKGSALVDYMIPTAVIGLVVGLSMYTMVDKNTLINFAAKSLNLTVNTSTGVAKSGKTTLLTQGGSLGGTMDNPVKICENYECSIDYGEFILTGIPDDFATFVQSSGTSGSTEKLISLIDQIADQLESKGDTQGANDFRELAALGHFISDIEEVAEQKAQYCGSQADPMSCYVAELNTPTDMTLSNELNTLLPGYASNPTPTLMELIMSTKIDHGRMNKEYDPSFFDLMNEISPSYGFIDKYDSIMANSNYSDGMKDITKSLYLQINDLSTAMHGILNSAVKNNGAATEFPDYDPLTGNYKGVLTSQLSDTNSVMEPDTSNITDLDSSLICALGDINNCN
ncbi:MAG: hypothetical protein AB7V50_03565 [Vampirovibrionia bacterium]